MIPPKTSALRGVEDAEDGAEEPEEFKDPEVNRRGKRIMGGSLFRKAWYGARTLEVVAWFTVHPTGQINK